MKTKTKTKAKTTKKDEIYKAIVGHGPYGITYGDVKRSEEPPLDGAVHRSPA